MLVYMSISLVIILFTLHHYIFTSYFSYSHKLLPLVLGLVCLYNFYLIVEFISGDTQTFSILKSLLIIHLLYVITCYFVAVTRFPLNRLVRNMFCSLLVLIDFVVVMSFDNKRNYHFFAFIGDLIIFSVMLFVVIYAIFTKSLSKKEKLFCYLLYLAILMPALGTAISYLTSLSDFIVLPTTFIFCCVIINYLLSTNQMEEVRYQLKTNYFVNSDIPTSIFDSDYNFLEANEMSYKLFPDFWNDANITNFKNSITNLSQDQEFVIKDRFYRLHKHPVKYRNCLFGYIISFVDITSEKNETRRMEILKNEAEAQSRSKSAFLANTSHDLRSPLHAIIGGSEVLLNKNNTSCANRKMLFHIRDAGLNLLHLVNDVLDYSKLENGKLELNHEGFDFEDLLLSQAHDAFMLLKNRPIDFSMVIEDETPKLLIADEIRIREIMQNLISNACKFTSSGSITLKIGCSYIENTRVKLVVSVADTGVGMSQEQMDKIFGEYVTFNKSRHSESTGLGLSIVKQLCELMDGNVRASSDGKTGSTVSATFFADAIYSPRLFPMEISSDNAIVMTSSAPNVKPDWIYPGSKILVADDMAVNLEIIQNMLRPWQIMIDFAANGVEAVEFAKNNTYDLIILDQMMPRMTGEEAAAIISGFCDTPLVMLTADISEDRKEECKKYGFSKYLTKPINLTQLKTTVEDLLPVDKRQNITFDFNNINSASKNESSLRFQLATAKSYLKEISELKGTLPTLFTEDLELFRIKVHGIKSVSKQLERNIVGYHAEILEMAAKVDNKPFIEIFLPEFIENIEITIEELTVEIIGIENQLNSLDNAEESTLIELDKEVINTYFDKIHTSFIKYDSSGIENAISALQKCRLSESEQALLNDIINAYEDFDYEKGATLF